MTRRIRPSHTVLALMILFLVHGSTGCSEDDSPTVILDNGGAATEYALPLVSDADAGRDQLVANLELGYQQLHYGEYQKLIHASYVFRVDPSEIDVVGLAELSAAEDLESTFGMFSGETGLEPVLDSSGRPTGEFRPVPAVQSIGADLTPASESSWTLMTAGEFSGAWRRVYALSMTVNYSGDTRTDQIVGHQVLDLAASVLTVDGLVEEVWKIRAWEDQGLFRTPHHGPGLAARAANDSQGSLPLAAEPTSLGHLKSLF